jgi:hypothetical protein
MARVWVGGVPPPPQHPRIDLARMRKCIAPHSLKPGLPGPEKQKSQIWP